jgi:hypothetical protein
MATIQIIAPSTLGLGGIIQGAFGNYAPQTDGSYNVDVRDAVTLLNAGFTYVSSTTDSYTTPLAPAAATIGQIVASGALSNGTIAVSNGTDIVRPVTVEVGTGTAAITAGTVAVRYTGNDGLTTTESYSLVTPANGAVTQTLSRGVSTISSITVSGLVGGTSPWFRMSTTAALSLPVAPTTIDFAVTKEYDAGATATVGSLGTSLASIFPTNAPNGTRTYSFLYTFASPVT